MIVKELFPDIQRNGYISTPSYRAIVETFCDEILIEDKADDYQGDSWYLLKKGKEYGFLTFGWGSCSGCDALEACESYEDLEKLYHDLQRKITWHEWDEAKRCVKERDWLSDFSWHEEDYARYIRKLWEFFKLPVDEMPQRKWKDD